MATQKIDFPPMSSAGGLAQLCRSLNANFGKVSRAFNQRTTTQVLYDTDHATARVLIGKVSDGSKKYVVAVSREGVDVVRALSASKPNRNDFIFYSETINEELEKTQKLFEKTVEALKIVRDLFNIVASAEGMEAINTVGLNSKIAEIEALEEKQ